ncbi:LacI family DNA-binding transcriptional regulator [Rhizobium leguminosarum]|uniref:LacI family DNA-binding transcriptional regulator n=1 Tax=Rhizobium leguminosarum TaxID=384 RepID=UPI001CDCD5FF|nr:LacI family DNA-binding transcriptional regulator [Rhizobium leguminosarum]MCA2411286.1 LacI family transcriptional regulator [Rhizobium leguminosarum]
MPSKTALVESNRPRKSRPTMIDIARLAEVDVSTVSRALAGSSRVTDETKQRIRKIVEETGYVVNHGARMLRNQMAGNILVILPNIAATFFPEVILGIEETVHKEGMSVIIGSTQYDRTREDELARQLLNGAADGIILLNGHLPDAVRSFPGFEQRIVAVSRAIEEKNIPYVNIDNEKAIETAVLHLIGLGYTDIAHLGGPRISPTFAARIKGYEMAMAGAGLADRARVEAVERFNIDGGQIAMEQLLKNGAPPEAIVCASDEMAMGAIRHARKNGLRVPEDIAFVGFDDIPFAAVYEPALTTVRTPRRKMGELGAQMLLKNLKNPSAKAKRIIVDHELVVRESCGASFRRG